MAREVPATRKNHGVPAPGCGNGILEAGEDCDGSNVGLATCLAVTGKQEGTLGCDADCSFITDDCHTCGDGVLEGPEDCEEGNVGPTTCLDAGYSWGDITCDSECHLDLSQCFAVCGNGRAEPGEECDGQDLNGLDCQLMALEFTGGALKCSSSCLLNVAECSTCGNGNLDAATEECDGADMGGATCATLSAGVMTGALGCTPECRRDVTGCTAQPTCGNGIVEVGEQCDGHTLNGQTCESLFPGLYGGGVLTCAANCLYDTTWCLPEERCGNGVIEPDYGEECDGANLAGYTCSNLGYIGGQLTCTGNCALDLSGCSAPVTCGNGVLDPMFNEACDGTELNGQTCANLGFYTGTLACNGQCDFDTSACTTCGDGIQNGPDECDGSDFGGVTCQSLGYYGGQLACSIDCSLDISDCESTGRCDDGIVNGSENCDGIDLGGSSCSSLGYLGGTLACLPDCTFDEWACTTCGNGVIEPTGEDCEGANLNGQTCETLLNAQGTLACDSACLFDTSGCYVCGNGVVEPGETCDDGDATDWDGCTSCQISEFQVNSYFLAHQQVPDVAVAPDGSFVIVWQSLDEDGDGFGIYARRYDAQGQPVQAPFQVNSTTAFDQTQPAVAVAGDGRFVVVWAHRARACKKRPRATIRPAGSAKRWRICGQYRHQQHQGWLDRPHGVRRLLRRRLG